jgi:hypothetical protein
MEAKRRHAVGHATTPGLFLGILLESLGGVVALQLMARVPTTKLRFNNNYPILEPGPIYISQEYRS